MECKKCKKDCLESELINGFCNDCILKYKDNSSELYKSNNIIASYFKIWAILAIVVGIVISLLYLVYTGNFFITVICLCSSLVVASVLRAISEIIQLLEDIKNK